MGFFHKFPYTDFHELNLDWLLSKMKELEGRVGDIKQTIIDQLQAWLDDGTLEDIINDEIFGDLSDQIEGVERLTGVKCLCVGNSYARGTGGTIGHGWPYFFQQITGADVVTIQQAGGDFADVGNNNADYPGMTFREAIQSYSSTLTADQKKEFKHIIFGGGFNDAVDADIDATDVANEIAACLTLCRGQFPNAKLHMVPLWSNANFSSASMLARLECWPKYGALQGASVIDDSIFWFIGDADYTYGDNIHLNENGYMIAGRLIASFVAGGQATRVPYVGEGCTLAPGMSVIGTGFRVTRDTQGQVSGVLHVALPDTEIDNTTKIAQLGPKFIPREALYFIGYDFTPGYADRHLCCVCITSGGEFYFRAVEGDYPASGHELYLHFNYRIGID